LSKPLPTVSSLVTINNDEIPIKAMKGIKETFGENHKPSKAHWSTIREIVKNIEGQASGSIGKEFYASFLDCGMGKTTALIHSVKAILSLPHYDRVGFIIFLSKLNEIKKLVKDMALDDEQFAVIVGKEQKELNALGNADKKSARVLFTTQQMLEKRAKECGSFSDITDFHFQGKPRKVRVWDEAIFPSRIMTLKYLRLLGVLEYINQTSKELCAVLQEFGREIDKAEDDRLVEVPNLEKFETILEERLASSNSDSHRKTIESLMALQGKQLRVSKDKNGTISLTYEDILPRDIVPMLILDAGGRNKETYRHWLDGRGGISFLPYLPKSYEGFQFKHWDIGSGKAAQSKYDKTYKRNGKTITIKSRYKEIATGVARIIDNDVPPHEKVLVVHHLANDERADMVREILERVRTDKDRIAFLNWGQHTATNEFIDYAYEIQVGVHQYNTAEYKGALIAAKGSPIDETLREEDLKSLKLSEVGAHILQACCRTKVRRTIGDRCPSGCVLYSIFSSQDLGGEDFAREIFPGCTYEKVSPIVTLQGQKQKELAALILEKGPGEYSLKWLMKTTGTARPARLEERLNDIEPYLRIEHGLYSRIYKDKLQVQKPKRPKDWLDHPF